jgi:hypothetical protein
VQAALDSIVSLKPPVSSTVRSGPAGWLGEPVSTSIRGVATVDRVLAGAGSDAAGEPGPAGTEQAHAKTATRIVTASRTRRSTMPRRCRPLGATAMTQTSRGPQSRATGTTRDRLAATGPAGGAAPSQPARSMYARRSSTFSARSARRPSIPTRSTNRRSCGPWDSQAARAARTRCGHSARRFGNRRPPPARA